MVHQIDCFAIHLKFFKYFGIWTRENDQFLFYNYYSKVFVFFFIVLYDILFTINFIFIPRQLDQIVEEMILYLTVISVASKAFTFILLHDDVQKILDSLESEVFQPEGKERKDIIEKTKNMNKFYWQMFAVSSVTSNLSHALVPLILNLAVGFELFLPVCSYAFISQPWIETFIYPLYLYQIIGIHINMWFNVNIDSFFLGIMNLIIAQLNILDDELRNVTDGDVKDSDEERIFEGFDEEEKLYLKLKQIIEHYRKVANFCDLVENTFSVTLFIQFNIASNVICVCLYRLTMPLTLSYLIFLLTYILVMVLQILIPCWFGHQITDKSARLVSSAYSCEWPSRPRRFTTSLRVLMLRLDRPLSITGGKIFPLLLTTFTSIANSAYSFYTLLRNMQTNK